MARVNETSIPTICSNRPSAKGLMKRDLRCPKYASGRPDWNSSASRLLQVRREEFEKRRSCESRTLQLVVRGNVDGRPSSHFDTVDRKIEKRVLNVDR